MRRVVWVLLAAALVASSFIVAAPHTAAAPGPVAAPRSGIFGAPSSTVPFFPNTKIIDHSTPYAWQVEPTMVVNRSGTIFVGWKETDGPETAGKRVGSSYSTDDGLTWAPNILMNQSHPNQNCHNSDPWMALGPDDRVHYAYLEYDCGSNSYLDLSNTTTGNDWGSVHSVAGNGGLVDKDAMWVAPDNRIYAMWDEGNVLAVTWSDDGGTTWKKPFVNPQDSPSSSVLGTVIETAANGTVYVVWWDFSRSNIYFDWSGDRGTTWHTDKRVNDRDGSAAGGGWQLSIPAMNVDQNSGAIYVAWPDTRNGNLDVYMSGSTDGGLTWSANTRVNDDTGSTIQYMVDLAIDGAGTVHAAWEDKRSGAWNIYYSNSTDGGQTWIPNVLVSSEETAGSYNRPGDYFAIEAGPGNYIYVVWTDGRGADFDIYYARNPGFPAAVVTIATEPAGLLVTVDNVTAAAPITKAWSVGSVHTIGVASLVPISPTSRYVWTSWSDGGAASHAIVANVDRTIMASFTKQFQGQVRPDPLGLRIDVDDVAYTAMATFWWDEGSVHTVDAPTPQPVSADVRYVWSTWSDGGPAAHLVTANAAFALTATFIDQRSMRVSTSPAGLAFSVDGVSYSTATTFWFQPDTYHIVSTSGSQSAPGTRYTFDGWDDGGAATHVVAFQAAMTIQASFSAEYYLTVTSPLSGATGSGWYAAGATIVAEVQYAEYIQSPGERLVFRGWSGDASGGGLTSLPIRMDRPKEAVALYGTQFHLGVTTDFGEASGSGWYDDGSSAYAIVAATEVPRGPGVREFFLEWTGDASGTTATSSAIGMDGPKTATAHWETEYLLQVESDVGTVEGAGWYAAGEDVTLRAPAETSQSGTTYRFTGWTGSVTSADATVVVTMHGPMSVRATWQPAGALGGLSNSGLGLGLLVAVVAVGVVLFLLWRRGRRKD